MSMQWSCSLASRLQRFAFRLSLEPPRLHQYLSAYPPDCSNHGRTSLARSGIWPLRTLRSGLPTRITIYLRFINNPMSTPAVAPAANVVATVSARCRCMR